MAFPTDWLKKHKITIDNTKVSGSSNLTDFPVLLTEDNFLAEIFSNSQGKEINTNYLLNDADLEGYWRLEADGSDESVNNYDLTGSGTPTHTTGKFGNGVDLELSSSQRYSIAHASCANLAITGSRTFSAWVKLESIGAFNQAIISKMGEDNSYRGYTLRIDGTAGTAAIYIQGLTTNQEVSSNVKLVVGRWYHVAGVYDSANSKLKIFVNGLKKEVTASGSSIDSGKNFALGCTFAGASNAAANFFDGIIDDAAVWSRALSDEEIVALYTGGADLRFSTDLAGSNQIPHEVVNWDTANGEAEVYVKIPTLDYNDDTVFYVWYGKDDEPPLARNNTYGADNVWTDYGIVLHMEGSYRDSSPNANDLTPASNFPDFATGKIGEGLDFEASENDYAEVSDNASLSVTSDFNFEFWRNLESGVSGTYFSKYNYTANQREYILEQSGSKITVRYSDDGVTGGDATRIQSDNNLADTGVWEHIFGAVDVSARTMLLYVDGSNEPTTANAGNSTSVFDGTSSYRLGLQNDGSTNPLDGVMDELRWRKGLLSADWGITQYNNQSDPDTFAIPSEASQNDERESEVSGAEAVDDERESEVHGVEEVANERDSEITGVKRSSERESEITGANPAETSERGSEITGYILTDEREAEIHGKEAVDDEKDSEIHGVQEFEEDRNTEVEGVIPRSDRATQIFGKADLEIARTYRILVKDENDEFIGEFDKFRALTFGKRLNNYGTASFEIPITDEKATELISLRKYTIWIYRQEDAETTLVWAGEQAMRDATLDSAGNGWATIHCFTWLEQLNSRFTADFVEFDGVDAGAIAWSMINTTQGETDGDFGITEGTIETTINRVRHYYNQNIMEAIINLANVISGFDFEITDEKVFNVASVLGEDKTDDVILEYGTNIVNVRITDDFITPVNRAIVLGQATDATTIQRVDIDDEDLQDAYKLREYVLNEMDISELDTFTDKGEALIRKYGTSLIKVEPELSKASNINITDFSLGDSIRLIVDYGIYDIDGEYRVFEWEVKYDSNNTEKLSLVLGNFTLQSFLGS